MGYLVKVAALAAKVAIVLLVLVGLLFQVLLPSLVSSEVQMEPDLRWAAVPAVAWGIALIGCGQLFAVILWKLLSLSLDTDIFSKRAFPWVKALIWTTLAATVLTLAAFVGLFISKLAPPGPMYSLLVLALVGVTLNCTLVAMYSLLRRATSAEEEMSRVI